MVKMRLTNYTAGEAVNIPWRSLVNEPPHAPLCGHYGRLAIKWAAEQEYILPGDRFRFTVEVIKDDAVIGSWEIAGVWSDDWRYAM